MRDGGFERMGWETGPSVAGTKAREAWRAELRACAVLSRGRQTAHRENRVLLKTAWRGVTSRERIGRGCRHVGFLRACRCSRRQGAALPRCQLIVALVVADRQSLFRACDRCLSPPVRTTAHGPPRACRSIPAASLAHPSAAPTKSVCLDSLCRGGAQRTPEDRTEAVGIGASPWSASSPLSGAMEGSLWTTDGGHRRQHQTNRTLSPRADIGSCGGIEDARIENTQRRKTREQRERHLQQRTNLTTAEADALLKNRDQNQQRTASSPTDFFSSLPERAGRPSY